MREDEGEVTYLFHLFMLNTFFIKIIIHEFSS